MTNTTRGTKKWLTERFHLQRSLFGKLAQLVGMIHIPGLNATTINTWIIVLTIMGWYILKKQFRIFSRTYQKNNENTWSLDYVENVKRIFFSKGETIMINNKRFITEYRNYLVKGFRECDINDDLRNELITLMDKYINACHAGLISINECMLKLTTICSSNNIRGFLNDWYTNCNWIN